MKFRHVLLACCAAAVSIAAPAQDVVVMRRVIAPPAARPGPPTPVDHASWQVTDWTQPTGPCGSAGTETRALSCTVAGGIAVDETRCTGGDAGPRPASSRPVVVTSSCTFAWHAGTPSDPAPACGATVRSRQVDCLRSDGTPVDEARCAAAGARPSPTVPATDFSTCTFDWSVGGWDGQGACGVAVTRTRKVTCLRSNGDDVDDAACTSAKPASEETITDLSACTYEPTYAYGACIPNASRSTTGTQAASVASCRRNDGTPVPPATAECNARTADNDRRCTLSYVGSYSGTFGACHPTTFGQAAGTQTAPITACTMVGSDGSSSTVSADYCPDQTTSRECSASYAFAGTYAYGACVDGGQTGTLTPGSCIATASDGTTGVVADAACLPQRTQTCAGTVFKTGFETGDTAYTAAAYDGAAPSTAKPRTGASSLAFVRSGASYPFALFRFNAVANTTYQVSFWVHYAGSGVAPHVYWNQVGGRLTDLGGVPRSTGWQKVAFSLTTSANGEASAQLTAFDAATPTYVDDVAISR